ncbi:MAG: polyhydroxyalkanoic acid system family protein [Tepidisphaeraceae bacterium]
MASSRAIEVSIPHQLPRAEVKVRLQAKLDEMVQGTGLPITGRVEHTWTGDRLDFVFHAMTQRATGRLDVLDDRVNVQIDLPWLLAKLAASLGIGKQIESHARLLLR